MDKIEDPGPDKGNAAMSEVDMGEPSDTISQNEAPSTMGNEKDLEKNDEEPPYTIFTDKELMVVGVFISAASIWSVLSLSLFFPAIPNVTKDFGISTGLANLAVVFYLIFQAIAPLFISTLADTIGRRPVSLCLLFSFTCVCIGISQVRVFWGLVVLRSVQAISIASTIATTFGIVGDLTPRATRGGYAGFISGITLGGQAFGGLIGGLLVSRWNWPGIFVFAAIGGGITFIGNFIFVPETNRSLVGNQSFTPNLPKYFWRWCPILYLPTIKQRLNNDRSTILPQTKKSSIINTLKIFFNKIVFFTLLPGGLQFATWSVSQSALSTILKEIFLFNEIQIGLCYLPSGFGSIIASILGGRILNWNYKRRKDHWDQLSEPKPPFNIHQVRSEFATRLTMLNAGATIAFGWLVDKHVNLAPMLIFLFIHSFCTVAMLSILQTLLVDLYPAQASASSSCLNLMRGLLSAIFVAAQQKMMDSISIGGTFTLLAAIYAASFAIFKVVVYYDSKRPVTNDK